MGKFFYLGKSPLYPSGVNYRQYGGALFPCHKFPEITVGLSDCMDCPFGDYYQDWDQDGWEECWYEWQKDLQRLKELEQEREKEKRENEDFLRQYAEDCRRLEEIARKEVEEHEIKMKQKEEEERKRLKLLEELEREEEERGGEPDDEEDEKDQKDGMVEVYRGL